jgi:basic membrane protein A
VTDNARMLKICMEEVMSGEFGNKTIYGNLENGSLSVGTFSDAVPEDIKAQYLEIVEQIKEGTFIQ